MPRDDALKQVSKEEFFNLYFRYSGAEAAGASREVYHKNFFEAEEKPGMTYWATERPTDPRVAIRIEPGETEIHLFLDTPSTNPVTATATAAAARSAPEPRRTDLNFCIEGGFLVGGDDPLPTDPTDYDDGTRPVRGCNQLRCRDCGQMVRHVPGKVRGTGEVDCAATYALADLAASPAIEQIVEWRFYLCSCKWENTLTNVACDDRDNPWGFANWSCAGHPKPKPPHISYGVEEPEC